MVVTRVAMMVALWGNGWAVHWAVYLVGATVDRWAVRSDDNWAVRQVGGSVVKMVVETEHCWVGHLAA
jgi:hypothetical protein